MWWTPKHKRQKGYLTRKNRSLMDGELITFTNGLVIVKDWLYDNKYEVVQVSPTKYRVIDDEYEFFLLAE